MEEAIVNTPVYWFGVQAPQLGNCRAVSELSLTLNSNFPTLFLPFLQEVPQSNELMYFFHIFPSGNACLPAILKKTAFAWISVTYIEFNIVPILNLFKKKSSKGKHVLKVSVWLLQVPFTVVWDYNVSFASVGLFMALQTTLNCTVIPYPGNFFNTLLWQPHLGICHYF